MWALQETTQGNIVHYPRHVRVQCLWALQETTQGNFVHYSRHVRVDSAMYVDSTRNYTR